MTRRDDIDDDATPDEKPPSNFETPGAIRSHTCTKQEYEALMANRTRPLTDPHMHLHRGPGDTVAPDHAALAFGVHVVGGGDG